MSSDEVPDQIPDDWWEATQIADSEVRRVLAARFDPRVRDELHRAVFEAVQRMRAWRGGELVGVPPELQPVVDQLGELFAKMHEVMFFEVVRLTTESYLASWLLARAGR